MIDSEAVVTRVDGDYVWLEFAGDDDCGQCASGHGCGLGKREGRPAQRVRNGAGARVGDTVVVTVPDGAVLRAAAIAYGMPLALVLAGAAAGMAVAGDGGALAGTGGGLLAGWLALGALGRRGEPGVAMRIKPVVVNFHRDQKL